MDAQTSETGIYWHRELPPTDAEVIGDHTLEAVSLRVPGTLAHRDELWDRCYHDLKAQTTARLKQEMERLGGQYAHVLDEAIDTRRDQVTGEAWLHGRFTYVLLRRAAAHAASSHPGQR
jgi:hypothetical protein